MSLTPCPRAGWWDTRSLPAALPGRGERLLPPEQMRGAPRGAGGKPSVLCAEGSRAGRARRGGRVTELRARPRGPCPGGRGAGAAGAGGVGLWNRMADSLGVEGGSSPDRGYQGLESVHPWHWQRAIVVGQGHSGQGQVWRGGHCAGGRDASLHSRCFIWVISSSPAKWFSRRQCRSCSEKYMRENQKVFPSSLSLMPAAFAPRPGPHSACVLARPLGTGCCCLCGRGARRGLALPLAALLSPRRQSLVKHWPLQLGVWVLPRPQRRAGGLLAAPASHALSLGFLPSPLAPGRCWPMLSITVSWILSSGPPWSQAG